MDLKMEFDGKTFDVNVSVYIHNGRYGFGGRIDGTSWYDIVFAEWLCGEELYHYKEHIHVEMDVNDIAPPVLVPPRRNWKMELSVVKHINGCNLTSPVKAGWTSPDIRNRFRRAFLDLITPELLLAVVREDRGANVAAEEKRVADIERRLQYERERLEKARQELADDPYIAAATAK